MTEISLGKNGKSGSIDFSKIKSGIKKDELLNGVDSKLKSVFEQIFKDIDTDPSDNMLSRKELETFFAKVSQLANKKDGDNLSADEAKEYQLADGSKLGKKGKDALFALLNKLSDLSKDSKVTKNQDGSETNEYPDGRKETVFPDGHKVVVTKNGKKAVTTTLDKDGKETEREETTEAEDGSVVTTSFKAGKPKTKIVQKGNVKQSFSYDENAQDPWRLDSTTETTDDETVNTDYEYAEGHKKTTETRRKKGQTEPHKTTTRSYDGENLVEEVVKESGQPQITKKVKSPQAHTETYTKDGADYTVEYSGKKPISQTVVKDGKTYQVNYDEDGYTTGIIVQNGETIKAIADRFGVSPEDLVRANAKLLKGKSYFNVGAEIRIPRKLQADETALQGRKDSASATAEYNAEMQRRAEQRRAEQAKRAQAERAQAERAQRTPNAQQAQKGKAATPKQAPKKAMKRKFTLKSGRYVTVENGTVKYYSANNVQLKKEYFIQKEGYDPVEMHPTGRYSVKIGKETKYYAKDGVQLQETYFKKIESANVKAKGKASLSNKGVRYVKSSDGKVRYYNANGAEITGSQRTAIIKAEAKLVAQILIEGTSYIGSTGLGTNEKKLEEGISKVYSPEIMAEVNNILKSKGYKSNNLITPIEDLFLSEVSRSEARGYIKALAKAGGYGVGAARDKAMGRNCAREIDWELHGGLTGYTGSKNLKEALRLADTRAARLETERIVGAKQTTCGKVKGQPDHGSWVRAYVAEDGWNAIEVDIFDMIWMKNGAYTHKEDQAHRNGLIRRSMTADNTPVGKKNRALVREARNTAYDAIEMGTADETTARQVAREENRLRKHNAQYDGQDELQTFIAGTNTDENGQVNAARVAANNTNLYKSSKPAEVQAREILNYVDNGDYSHVFDSMDPEVYAKLNELTGNPDYVKYMYDNLMKTAKGNDKMKIMSNAILSKQIEFKKQELVDFCIELMHSIDDNFGVGTSSGQSAGGINIAEYQTTQLQAILAQHPEILNDVKQRVAKEKFVSHIHVGSAQYAAGTEQTMETDRKDVYQNILNNTYTVDSKSKFYYEDGEEITDPAVVDYIIKSQKDSLKDLRQLVAELEREFNKTVDSEGGLSNAANFLSEYSGIGTDRDDVRTRYRKAKLWLNQLEAAAEGKLRDSSGKPVSFQELAQKINAEVENLNSDYNTTISYGKIAVVMGPVLLVTLPASAGATAIGGAIGLGTTAINLLTATTAATAAGGTTYLLNYAEMQTSVTGDTMEAREKNYLESSVAAFTTLIGVGQMKYICNMFKTAGAFAKAGGRLTTVLASDMGVAGVGEYIQSGTITKEGLTMTLLFSATGNLIGIKSLTKNPTPKAMPKAEYTPPKGTNPEGIVPKNAKRLPDGTSQHVSSKDGVNTVDTYYYDADGNVIGQKTVINGKTSYLDANGHLISEADFAKIKQIQDANTPVLDRIDKNGAEGSVGKLNPENYAELQREVNYKLEHATTEAELDELTTEINKLQNRDQRRPLLQQIEAKKAELHADAPHVDEPESVRAADNNQEAPSVDEPERVKSADNNPEVAHVDEPASSLNDPVKAAGLRRKLGQNLFAIYQAVERGIDSLKDISGYNKLKAVIANKFKKSPTEFSELITRLNNKAKKLGLKVVETTVDRTARMGKSLAKYYDKIESAISSMKDLKRFNKLLDKITTKFVNFKDDMKALLDKLYDRAKVLGLSIKESIHDVYARVGIKADGVNPLDKYTRRKKSIDMNKSHDDWFNSRQDLFCDNHDYPGAVWSGYTPKDRHHGAWKMHLYSVSEADWREMCDVIIPYLKEHDIDWKTFNAASGADCLNGTKQQGKAFTIYPKNNEDMAQIAKDLDYIIRKNKLETNNSHITGDNQMGSTGRLFYRYEFNSKAHQNEILDLSPGSKDWDKYYQTDKYGRQTGGYYDANRGEGKYLADDMTLEDDIWRNFDPSDPNAMPSTSSSARSSNTRTAKLQKGQSVEIQGSTKLNLANTIEIDLNDPRIKTRIDNLPEGGRLTIGREGDIRINDPSNRISRVHVIIEKRNGKLHVIDNSTNGTTVKQTVKSAQSPAPSGANSATQMERMQKGQRYELQNYPKIRLANTIEIDLNDTVTRSRINNLRDGQQLTIGREGDIQINDPSNRVSRIHVIIERRNGRIYIIDNSTNGTSIAKNTNNRTANSNVNRNSNFDPSAQNVRSNVRNSNVNSEYDTSYDMNLNGFRRNPNAQTNVKGIKPNEVQVGGTYTGYSYFTDCIYKNVDADLRNGFLNSNANSFVAYNAANNVTSIGIKTTDACGRPGIFNITIKGQVSENDAVNLLAHLESKNLLPTGKSNSYSMKYVDVRYLQSIARRIQEEVATFFS